MLFSKLVDFYCAKYTKNRQVSCSQ